MSCSVAMGAKIVNDTFPAAVWAFGDRFVTIIALLRGKVAVPVGDDLSVTLASFTGVHDFLPQGASNRTKIST